MNRARDTTNRIAKLEAEVEQLRLQRAADLARLAGGEADDESDQLTPGAIGVALGISRQNVQKAIRDLGPDSPRGQAYARRVAAEAA